MAYDIVANLISDAAIELGLAPTPIVDPFASTDANILRLVQLLKSGGRDMAKHRNWSHLRKEFVFATAPGTQSYALPADFRCFIPGTGWDRTTSRPMGGPIDGEYWQFTQAVPIAGTFIEFLRLWQGKMFFVPTPGAAETMAIEYQPTSWCGVTGAVLPAGNTKDAPTLKDDVVFFEPNLVSRRLCRDYRRKAGFDSSVEDDDYQTALYTAALEDSPGHTIYIGGRSDRAPRKIDRWNIPDSGAGQ